MEFNSELKKKLNKHAAEQSEKLSDLVELPSKVSHLIKKVKEIVPALNGAFQSGLRRLQILHLSSSTETI